MSIYTLAFKLIATPFLAIGVLFLTDSSIFFYPLVFSLTLGLSNYNLLRHNLVLGLLIGLIFSYLTYFVGLLSFIITASGNQDKGISNNITIGEWINIDLAFTFTVMIIAPFLTMIVQKSIYKNTNSKLSNSIIAVTIVIITIISFFINHQQTNYVFDIFSLWHIICLFGLQLIINQTQLLKLIKI